MVRTLSREQVQRNPQRSATYSNEFYQTGVPIHVSLVDDGATVSATFTTPLTSVEHVLSMDRGQAVSVHERFESRNVGKDRALRLRHAGSSHSASYSVNPIF